MTFVPYPAPRATIKLDGDRDRSSRAAACKSKGFNPQAERVRSLVNARQEIWFPPEVSLCHCVVWAGCAQSSNLRATRGGSCWHTGCSRRVVITASSGRQSLSSLSNTQFICEERARVFTSAILWCRTHPGTLHGGMRRQPFANVSNSDSHSDSPPTANRPPAMTGVSVSPQGMGIEQTTNFTFIAQGVSDPDGDALTYSWTSSDGDTINSNASTASHVYRRSGGFDMRLTVTDPKGLSASAVVSVSVGTVTGVWDITCVRSISITLKSNGRLNGLPL